MATTLSTFKTALQYGGARPSLFEFSVSASPTGVSADLSGAKLYCNVSELPGLSITPIERQYFGRTVKIPGDIVFADLTTTFINTEKFNVRNELEKWMGVINGVDADTNKGISKSNFGTGTAHLEQFQKDGKKSMRYTFEDCWPTNISEIALSYDTSSEIETFDVTWAYNYFTFKGSNLSKVDISEQS